MVLRCPFRFASYSLLLAALPSEGGKMLVLVQMMMMTVGNIPVLFLVSVWAE